MSEHGQSGRHPRTTPSQAIGESGDQEARREADRAVVEGGRSSGRRDTRRQGAGGQDTGGSPSGRQDTGGQEPEPEGHSAKRQRPGVGREEQVRPHDPRSRRSDRESDDR
ncbi:hypothetical protein ACFWCB_02285 [Streptomyces sp. NPDC060048]|uniref:hypothetical protein n=1 Tax=unclassified Streptomyces TaxID=2593676 RepID=UPI0036A255C4